MPNWTKEDYEKACAHVPKPLTQEQLDTVNRVLKAVFGDKHIASLEDGYINVDHFYIGYTTMEVKSIKGKITVDAFELCYAGPDGDGQVALKRQFSEIIYTLVSGVAAYITHIELENINTEEYVKQNEEYW